MKNTVLALLFAFAGGAPHARATNFDSELYAALEKVNDNTVINQRALFGAQDRLHDKILGGTLSAYTLFFFAGAKPETWKTLHMVFKISLAAFVGLKVVRYLLVAPLSDDPAGYRTAEQLKYFFAMPVPRQYRIAAQSPELRRFIMDVSRSIDVLGQGTPVVISDPAR